MNNLIVIQNNTILTSSEIIAEGVGNQHKNVIELVRKYQSDLEEFGGVAFETRPFETNGGVQEREIALLNEQQATLLLTYMQNTAIVREFKKALVKAFYNLVEDRKQMLELLKIEVQEAKLKANIEAEAAKLSIIASKKHATVEAYITKTEVAKMKLQAAKEKYAEQSKVLHARTTKLLSQGAKVKADMTASKLDLPVDTITNLLKAHGSKLKPSEANNALVNLGYLEPTRDTVTSEGNYYGRTIISSKSTHTTLARWFPAEFENLLEQINQYYLDKEQGLD